MSDQLQDEVLSINSIYDSNTLKSSPDSDAAHLLRLPTRPDIIVRIEFPSDYPDAPPVIVGTSSTGPHAVKGEGQYVVDVLRTILDEVFTPGVPCIFDLLEESRTRLQQPDSSPEEESGLETTSKAIGQDDNELKHDSNLNQQDLGQEPAWSLSESVVEKKSVFVARAAYVQSVEEAKRCLNHLLVTDKKAAKATHNITAWRIQGENDIQYQDCDDDGETAAGSRLLHLLELMNVWNVMVVVTRWYGGVHLGPDRFRIINQVARDAIVRGNFETTRDSKKKSKK